METIDTFFSYLDEYNFPVTLRAAYELEAFKNELAESAADHTLTEDEANRLVQIIADLEKTLFAESGGNLAFIVTDKRIDVNKLLWDMRSLMSPGTFDLLPSIAQYDFSEAGSCIAFGRSTAAAFHLLRGTEAVLRHFYCSIVKRDRVKPLHWGPMVKQLGDRSKPPPMPLLKNLDNIRLSFRNPTQHPEMKYDIEEVQDLFGLCIDVVNRMATLFINRYQT